MNADTALKWLESRIGSSLSLHKLPGEGMVEIVWCPKGSNGLWYAVGKDLLSAVKNAAEKERE